MKKLYSMKEHDVIESYDFGITNASIQAGPNGKDFKPYLGGSAVGGPFTTIAEARQTLFERLKNDIWHRLEGGKRIIHHVEEVRDMLGDDYFNMGHYKKFE